MLASARLPVTRPRCVSLAVLLWLPGIILLVPKEELAGVSLQVLILGPLSVSALWVRKHPDTKCRDGWRASVLYLDSLGYCCRFCAGIILLVPREELAGVSLQVLILGPLSVSALWVRKHPDTKCRDGWRASVLYLDSLGYCCRFCAKQIKDYKQPGRVVLKRPWICPYFSWLSHWHWCIRKVSLHIKRERECVTSHSGALFLHVMFMYTSRFRFT